MYYFKIRFNPLVVQMLILHNDSPTPMHWDFLAMLSSSFCRKNKVLIFDMYIVQANLDLRNEKQIPSIVKKIPQIKILLKWLAGQILLKA